MLLTNTVRLMRVGELTAVVRLGHSWRIAKADQRALHKRYRAVAAGFLAGVKEPFPAGFFDHGI